VIDGDHVVAGGAVDGAAEGFIVTTLGHVVIGVRADGRGYIAVRKNGDDAAEVIDEQVVDAVSAYGIARIAEIGVGEDSDGRSGHDVTDGGPGGLSWSIAHRSKAGSCGGPSLDGSSPRIPESHRRSKIVAGEGHRNGG
jgi:hypothetical protein